jgi:hypothetical protein
VCALNLQVFEGKTIHKPMYVLSFHQRLVGLAHTHTHVLHVTHMNYILHTCITCLKSITKITTQPQNGSFEIYFGLTTQCHYSSPMYLCSGAKEMNDIFFAPKKYCQPPHNLGKSERYFFHIYLIQF